MMITDKTISLSEYAVIRSTKVVLVSQSLPAAIREAIKKGGIIVSILSPNKDTKS